MNGDQADSTGLAANKDADCGLKREDFTDVTGGASFGLAIVSFLLSIGQAVVFVMANSADA
eukprot:m.113881 g.113881  ORF g.113881 m.113881 type:complete len:61 (-) comp21491_c1_seq1:150-332(-)